MSENVFRDRAIKRIKALINKTEENGASIEEAKSALEKATKLMKEYFITINEVEDLKDDVVVAEGATIIKIKEDVTSIYPLICDLLDLRHFYNKKTITFVGYKTDVKVGIYLYKKIMAGLLCDIDKYKLTADYSHLKQFYHPNTLRRDFITGWVYQIGTKVYELLSERERSIQKQDKTGLVLVKKENVDRKFSEYKVNTVKNKDRDVFSYESFQKGIETADDFNLQNDIDAPNVASILIQ